MDQRDGSISIDFEGEKAGKGCAASENDSVPPLPEDTGQAQGDASPAVDVQPAQESPSPESSLDRSTVPAGQGGVDSADAKPSQDVGSAANDDLLPVDDRLTVAKERQARRDAERRNRLYDSLAHFGKAAGQLGGGEPVGLLSAEELRRLLRRLLGPLHLPVEGILAAGLDEEWLDPEVWKGLWTVLTYTLNWQSGNLQRRLQGDYSIDDYGLDEEFLAAIMPLAQFMYRTYWRVELTGIEHVPTEGRALLVSNHSGVLPFDGAMISTAIFSETEGQRLVRSLVASWFPTLPFISILLQKTGQVQASPHNAMRLLQQDELVAVFPEGTRGVGKLYRDRYQLRRFGRGGFIRVAMRAGAPIIPVAVVGAEEIYPMIGRADWLARLLGFPFFPITPLFPWTGLLGFVPLPSKWSIDIGPPIPVETYGDRAAANPVLVGRLATQVRETIQQMLFTRLAKRRSIFLG